MKKTTTIPIVFFLVFILVSFTGCALSKDAESAAFLMGTVVNEKIYGASDPDALIGDIEDRIAECENEISWRIEGSSAFSLNNTGHAEFSDAKNLLDAMKGLYEESDGRFDITIGKVSTLWNIGTDDAKVPTNEEIENALGFVDGSKIKIDNNSVSCGDGQFIDLGAVGKGYACDIAREVLQKSDAKGACIAVGGSVLVYGKRGNRDKFTVAVRDPDGSVNDYVGTIEVTDCVVSTSGDYEHILEEDGVRYHHILDTETGYPVGFPGEAELKSVTVICDSGLMSDALSTACFACGLEDGTKLLEKYGAEGIFIKRDGSIVCTNGIDFHRK